MTALSIVYSPLYVAEIPENHRFPMSKFRLLADTLERTGLAPRSAFLEPSPLDEQTALLAHDEDYVRCVFSGDVPRHLAREIGFPMTETVIMRSRAACGGTLLTARRALAEGIACNMAGGSHHARRARGAGFCVFNDVAITILALLDEALIARPLVVDLDCHQGDGTADIFAGDERVFTLSLHGEKNYPLQKRASDLDIALPDGSEDASYMAHLEAALPLCLDRHRPDMVFYNAGVDVHKDDRLGRLALTEDGIARRDRYVIETVRRAGLPIACVIGGGYAANPQHVADLHLILFKVAADCRLGA